MFGDKAAIQYYLEMNADAPKNKASIYLKNENVLIETSGLTPSKLCAVSRAPSTHVRSTLGFELKTVSSLESILDSPALESRLLPPRRAEQRRGGAGGQGEVGGGGQGRGAQGGAQGEAAPKAAPKASKEVAKSKAAKVCAL